MAISLCQGAYHRGMYHNRQFHVNAFIRFCEEVLDPVDYAYLSFPIISLHRKYIAQTDRQTKDIPFFANRRFVFAIIFFAHLFRPEIIEGFFAR